MIIAKKVLKDSLRYLRKRKERTLSKRLLYEMVVEEYLQQGNIIQLYDKEELVVIGYKNDRVCLINKGNYEKRNIVEPMLEYDLRVFLSMPCYVTKVIGKVEKSFCLKLCLLKGLHSEIKLGYIDDNIRVGKIEILKTLYIKRLLIVIILLSGCFLYAKVSKFFAYLYLITFVLHILIEYIDTECFIEKLKD